MTAARLTVAAALAVAEATLAVARPADIILGAWSDDDGVAVAYGYSLDVVEIGPGPLLISRRDGTARWLGSLELHERLDAMTEVML